MSNFIGKICPYCKTEFRQGDDIVICSACEMPHHKECWIENQGCTTFGCLGTIKSADSTESTVTGSHMNYEESETVSDSVIYCTQCGTKCSSSSAFCPNCGNRLKTSAGNDSYQTQSNYSYQTQSNYSYQSNDTGSYQENNAGSYQSYQTNTVNPDLTQLIGIKTEYYIPMFNALKMQRKTTSWNWAAFLVAPYWFMYRKMYGYAGGILAADIIVSLIGAPVLSFIALAGYIVIGIYANNIYMNHLEAKTVEMKGLSEPYKSLFVASNGGVNTTATIAAVVGRIILMAILLK